MMAICIVVKGKSTVYDGNRTGDAAMLDNVQPAPPPSVDHGEHWEAKVKNILKAELKRRGVSYKELADRLAAIGVTENEPNIRNKLARGKFTAVFMVQVMAAIGANEIRLS